MHINGIVSMCFQIVVFLLFNFDLKEYEVCLKIKFYAIDNTMSAKLFRDLITKIFK